VNIEWPIRLPFGPELTPPIDTKDVAEVVTDVLEQPAAHVDTVIELTGPKSEDMRAVAVEFSESSTRPSVFCFQNKRQCLTP
jgi:NAD(P)H dehydrogenase (quinone)